MSNELKFKGSVSVSSTPAGLSVCFQGETDAHDLGHALAAIITTYVNIVQRRQTDYDIEELRDMVIDGIGCGLENNPDPMVLH